MNTAEQLADKIDGRPDNAIIYGDKAAAELRRLAAENERLRADAERVKPDCAECADWFARHQAARQWKADVAEGHRSIAAQVAAMKDTK